MVHGGPDVIRLLGAEFGPVVRWPHRPHPHALALRILHIVLLRSQEEMLWVDTGRNIALMQNLIRAILVVRVRRNRPTKEQPGGTVGTYLLLTHVEHAIPLRGMDKAHPLPTACPRIDPHILLKPYLRAEVAILPRKRLERLPQPLLLIMRLTQPFAVEWLHTSCEGTPHIHLLLDVG